MASIARLAQPSVRTSLDTMAKLIGLPGKVGVDGKDVGPLVHAGRIAEVEAYCLCDVAQTTGLFLRVQLLRGERDGLADRADGERGAAGAGLRSSCERGS